MLEVIFLFAFLNDFNFCVISNGFFTWFIFSEYSEKHSFLSLTLFAILTIFGLSFLFVQITIQDVFGSITIKRQCPFKHTCTFRTAFHEIMSPFSSLSLSCSHSFSFSLTLSLNTIEIYVEIVPH